MTVATENVRARRKSRESGTHIAIVGPEGKEGPFQVRCEEHEQHADAEKWGQACALAAHPRQWCPTCKDAPPPTPKPKREGKGGKAPQDQTPEEREALRQQATEAAAAARQAARQRAAEEAEQALPAARAELVKAHAAYRKAADAAAAAWRKVDRAKAGTPRAVGLEAEWLKLETAAENAQSRALATGARVRRLEEAVRAS